MPRMRFKIDNPDRVYEALVVAADAARESPVAGDVGPWNDKELRKDNVIELLGPDSFTDLVVQRWLDAAIGFEVE